MCTPWLKMKLCFQAKAINKSEAVLLRSRGLAIATRCSPVSYTTRLTQHYVLARTTAVQSCTRLYPGPVCSLNFWMYDRHGSCRGNDTAVEYCGCCILYIYIYTLWKDFPFLPMGLYKLFGHGSACSLLRLTSCMSLSSPQNINKWIQPL